MVLTKKIRGSTINVKIGDTVINSTQNAKLLGLHIDPYLKWDVEQNTCRAARAITKNDDYTIPSSKIIQKLGWMNINQRYKYFTGILMFKSLNKLAPLPLQNLFSHVSTKHSYNTRNASDDALSLPKCHLECYKQSFQYAGADLWNNISISISIIYTYYYILLLYYIIL